MRKKARRQASMSATTGLRAGVALVAMSAALQFSAEPAQAQAGPSANRSDATQLQDIVVTARRVQEKLETVPISVSAFGSAAIEGQDLRDLVDISRNVPGFQFQNQVGGSSGRNDRSSNSITFRGLFLGNFAADSQGGLVFIDGAPVIGAAVPAQDDVQRVEVLKGPQSVYFGRSTFTGAINFVTKDPTFDFGGRVEAAYGTYGSNQLSMSVNIPIKQDVIALRISGSHEYRGGQYTNAAQAGERLGNQKTDSVSGQLLIQPSDSLRIKAYASYAVQNDGPPAQAALKKDQFNCNLGGTQGPYYCGPLPNRLDPALISSNYAYGPLERRALFENIGNFPTIFDPNWNDRPGLKREILQAHLRADYEFENGMTFSSITAAHRDKTQTALDILFRDMRTVPNPNAGLPNAPQNLEYMFVLQNRFSDFSQELRLTSGQDGWLRWTVGGNYTKATLDGGVVYGLTPFGPGNASALTRSAPETPAVFGAVYIDPVPNLTISLEGRYQWDKIKQIARGTATGQLLSSPFELSKTFKSFSPRISVDYKITPTTMVYSLFSRGYRPGGFNAALAALNPATGLPGSNAAVYSQLIAGGGRDFYDQEKLDNYEAGVKARFLNNKASVRLTGYIGKYSGGQVGNQIAFFPTLPNGQQSNVANQLTVIQNIGKVDLKGIELEADLVPARGLTINGSFGLADSKIKQFVCEECRYIYGSSDAVGNHLPGVPRYTWTLGVAYERSIGDEWTAYTRTDYRHRGRQYVDNSNVGWSRNDDQIDLRLGARKGAFSLEAFALNLFNEQTLTAFQNADLLSFVRLPGYTSPSPTGVLRENRVALPQKRRLGLRASYMF